MRRFAPQLFATVHGYHGDGAGRNGAHRCPRAYLLTIGGESYAHGEMLSPKVSRRLPELKDMARRLIEDSLCQTATALGGFP